MRTVRHKFQVILSFPCTTQQDFDDLLILEGALIESLRPTPHVLDGHDCTEGARTMNFFIYTDAPEAAFGIARQSTGAGTFPKLKAAFRSLGANEYEWLWPRGCTEKFRLW